MIRSAALRQSAEGQSCTMNVAGVCNYDPETVVLAHLNESFAGKGMGHKATDIGVYMCQQCHSAYDTAQLHEQDKYFYLLRGVIRTLEKQREMGLITIKGAE